MNAEEMFEELGYVRYEDDNQIIYRDEYSLAITFYKKEIGLEIRINIEEKEYVVSYSFSLDEIRAINKQIQELIDG